MKMDGGRGANGCGIDAIAHKWTHVAKAQKIIAVTKQSPLQAFSSDQKLDVTGQRGAKRCSGRLTELLAFRSLRLRLRSVFLGIWVIERKAGRSDFK